MKRQWGFFSKAAVDRVLLPETGRSMVVVIIPELNGCSARESGHSDLKCQRVQSATSGPSRKAPKAAIEIAKANFPNRYMT
jgi:hypothetical protein